MNAAKVMTTAYAALALNSALALEKTEKVYRCENNGRIEYTEQPCLGAKEIDVTPTKGLETHKGANIRSPALQRERFREHLIEGIQPATGMDLKEFNKFERRQKLPPSAKSTCALLDKRLPSLDQARTRAEQKNKADAEAELFKARMQYKDLKC